jgi:arylamine N-acetyltransferase
MTSNNHAYNFNRNTDDDPDFNRMSWDFTQPTSEFINVFILHVNVGKQQRSLSYSHLTISKRRRSK